MCDRQGGASDTSPPRYPIFEQERHLGLEAAQSCTDGVCGCLRAR